LKYAEKLLLDNVIKRYILLSNMKYVNVEKQLKLIRFLFPKDTSETIFDILRNIINVAYLDGCIDVLKEENKNEKNIFNR